MGFHNAGYCTQIHCVYMFAIAQARYQDDWIILDINS